MNAITISDSVTTYTRISKRKAKELFDAGRVFYIIAHKMRPGMPFSMGMTIDGAHYARENAERAKYPSLTLETFESVVRNFEYYNANCHETGTYSAFYLMSER